MTRMRNCVAREEGAVVVLVAVMMVVFLVFLALVADIGILRIVVDDPDAARDLLVSQDYAFSESPILAVEIAGEHDVEGVLMALLEAEVNIHYMYSFISRPMGRSALAMSIEDLDIAMDILGARNHKVLSQRDISR